MEYRCIDVGRNKFNGTIFADSEAGIIRHLRKHVLSREIDLSTDDNGKTYDVIVGMFRIVGGLERVA